MIMSGTPITVNDDIVISIPLMIILFNHANSHSHSYSHSTTHEYYHNRNSATYITIVIMAV
jgi:hypothetical protein